MVVPQAEGTVSPPEVGRGKAFQAFQALHLAEEMAYSEACRRGVLFELVLDDTRDRETYGPRASFRMAEEASHDQLDL